MPQILLKKLDEIQPSQLFINSGKLSKIMGSVDTPAPESFEPIPLKALDDRVVFTDGHTRALAALLSGLTEVRVYWDEDDLDWEAYRICVGWCQAEGIFTIADLKDRVIAPDQYATLWLDRCQAMLQGLEEKRKTQPPGK